MNYQIINSLINKFDPELSHSLAIQFLKNFYIPIITESQTHLNRKQKQKRKNEKIDLVDLIYDPTY